jgi:hypothetical protein
MGLLNHQRNARRRRDMPAVSQQTIGDIQCCAGLAAKGEA